MTPHYDNTIIIDITIARLGPVHRPVKGRRAGDVSRKSRETPPIFYTIREIKSRYLYTSRRYIKNVRNITRVGEFKTSDDGISKNNNKHSQTINRGHISGKNYMLLIIFSHFATIIIVKLHSTIDTIGTKIRNIGVI